MAKFIDEQGLKTLWKQTKTTIRAEITNTIIDYADTLFTLTNSDLFTITHQHCYQIGNLLFIHIVFRTNKTVDETGVYTLGQLSLKPAHTHSFAIVPANPGVTNDMRVDPGYISTDGVISFDVTKTYSSKNYTFDITTFYCTDMTTTAAV